MFLHQLVHFTLDLAPNLFVAGIMPPVEAAHVHVIRIDAF